MIAQEGFECSAIHFDAAGPVVIAHQKFGVSMPLSFEALRLA
jgi:hypothetical protein